MNLPMKLMHCCFCCSVLGLACGHAQARAAQAGRFSCGGQVEQQVWDLWDEDVRGQLKQNLLQGRLLQQGDVYALYDFQSYAHNPVSMARRCKRTARLREVAELVQIAYGALEPGTPSSPGRRWVCRGGGTCNEKNRLLNSEVVLDSVQFLGLASSLANALASSNARLNDEDQAFISDTIRIVAEHLDRWADDGAIRRLRRAAEARPHDVKDGSSALFFTDHHLWLITIYAELAGLLQWQARTHTAAVGDEDRQRLREHLGALLRLFSARTSFQGAGNGGPKRTVMADLDRGYWRHYADHRYAGYEKEDKPVVCTSSKNGESERKMEVRMPKDSVRLPPDTGWDISHARRLVHALDALERNRKAMTSVFAIEDRELPPKRLGLAFADTLVASVWNGDRAKPLFSNYWSGANGWFRVAYDSGAGQCNEGYPPYGMSDSFPTGGYATWARYRPIIGVLGRRLYGLIDSRRREDMQFIARYYPNFAAPASTQSRALSKIMFLPSLVGVPGGDAQSGRRDGATHLIPARVPGDLN
jgi:hypothetical protein